MGLAIINIITATRPMSARSGWRKTPRDACYLGEGPHATGDAVSVHIAAGINGGRGQHSRDRRQTARSPSTRRRANQHRAPPDQFSVPALGGPITRRSR